MVVKIKSARIRTLSNSLKYWLVCRDGVEEAVGYGVRRASLEYVLRYLIPLGMGLGGVVYDGGLLL